MDLFTISAVVISLSALFGYLNVRFLKLPNTIGMMVVAILFTLGLFATALVNEVPLSLAKSLIASVDFETVLLEVMLGFLLFAGAMHTNFDQLRVQRWPIFLFATFGVLSSTFLVATLMYFLIPQFGMQASFIHCLLFGALISPTDPIAVLGILKTCGVPKKLETKIVGESLFNDGVGVVVFMTIMSIAIAGAHPVTEDHTGTAEDSAINLADDSPQSEMTDSTGSSETEHGAGETEHTTDASVAGVLKLFVQEVLGGIAWGLILGYVTFKLMKSIDDYEVEVLITLACVMGGYAFALYFHLSAPLAIVVAGLIVGHDTIRGSAMSEQTESYVDRFWELMDIMMNAILFVLIGLELLIVSFKVEFLEIGAIAIVIVLVSRFLSLLFPVAIFRRRLEFVPHTLTIMTWGGLRGGISIALALSLRPEMNRELFLTVTYVVVVFSIVFQAMTIGPLARKLIGSSNSSETKEAISAGPI